MKRRSFISILMMVFLVALVLFAFTACGDDPKDDPAHTHTYATEWSKDEDHHWHAATCEHQNEVKDKAAHTWDAGKVTKEPTVTETGVKTYTCTVCAQIKTEEIAKLPPAHEHSFAADWSKDATNHWHAATCEHKNEVKDKAAHTWDAGKVTKEPTVTETGVKTYTCTVCAQIKTEEIAKLPPAHEHSFAADWSKDATNHWHAATCEHKNEVKDKAAHTWDAGKVTKEPTETEAGVKTYTCTVCGQTQTKEIAKLPHTHTFANAWSKDENSHWHAATCEHKSEVKDKAAHSWGVGKITTPATEETEGVKTYTCTVCGKTKTETIGKLGHTHTFDTAKWTKDENGHWHAPTCGHEDAKQIIPHDYTAWNVKTPAGVHTDRVDERTCIVCGYADRYSVPETALHTYDEANWVSDFTGHWHKSTCEHEIPLEKDFAEHTFDKGVITTPATEEREGVKTFTCTVCGYTRTESVPKLPHTHKFSDTWSKDADHHWHAATCGHAEVKDKAAHTFDAGKVTKAPTETEAGVKTYACTVCGQTKTEEIARLDHTHTFDTSKWAKDANHHWHASICGHAEVKDKAAHTFDAGKVTKAPTETETGVKTYTCTVCGQTKTEEIAKLDHTHTFDTSKWAKDADYHWHAATCGHTSEKQDLAAHTWNDGVLDIDPDIGEEGSMLYTCTVCGQTKSEVIPALAPFFMLISDKFKLTGGKGIVIQGKITSGTVSVGDTITMSGANKPVTVEKISIGSKEVESATAGDEVGLLISGVEYESIQRGFCVYTPGTKSSYREFTLRLTLYTKAEGGRNTPILTGYAPQFRFYDYAADIKGQILLPSDVERMMPGETLEVTVVLRSETILEAGMTVVVQEGGKTVGTGTVVSVSEHTHTWDEGEITKAATCKETGEKTYTCTTCGQTKSDIIEKGEHDASYEDCGFCTICGAEQDEIIILEENDYSEFVATFDLEVNGSVYLKVTPTDESGTEYWRIEVEATGGITEGSDYEIHVYDSNGNEVTGDLETGKTYYIVIIGMNNINDVSITVLDHNAM